MEAEASKKNLAADLAALKLEALESRQLIETLLSFAADLQRYSSELAPRLAGGTAGPALLSAYENLRLSFNEVEPYFLEWNEGESIVYPPLSSLLSHADAFEGKPQQFESTLFLIGTKLKSLISDEESILRTIHEKIALICSIKEADEQTSISPSVVERLRGLDDVSERGYKWLERILPLLPKAISFFHGHF